MFGLTVFLTHSTIVLGWTEYAPVNGMAFYPGLPGGHTAIQNAAGSAPNRYASVSGQISIAVGLILVSGWIGFAMGASRSRS